MLMCDCLPCPFSPLSPVLAELRQADLITSEECEGLTCPSDVIKVQCAKSLEVLLKTADLLRRHGFEQVPEPAGRQSRPSAVCLYTCYSCIMAAWALSNLTTSALN